LAFGIDKTVLAKIGNPDEAYHVNIRGVSKGIKEKEVGPHF